MDIYIRANHKRKLQNTNDKENENKQTDRQKRLAHRAEQKRLQYASMSPEKKVVLLLKQAERRRSRLAAMSPDNKKIDRQIHAEQEWLRIQSLDGKKIY